MTIAGIGIDVVEIERLRAAIRRRPRLAERLFTPTEREYAEGRPRPDMHLAARFAAKEAVVKALGLTAYSFRDIEIVSGAPPSVRIHGSAARQALDSGESIRISLTHTRTTAAAVAIAITE